MAFTTTPATAAPIEAAKPTLEMTIGQTNDAKPEAKPQQTEQKPKEDTFSDRAQLLLRKEKRAFRERQETQALKAAIAQEKQGLETQRREYETWKSKLAEVQRNPLEALKLLGTDYNQLTQLYLNNGQPTPELQVQSVRQELEQIKRQQEELRLAQEAKAQQAAEQEYNEILEGFRESIGEFTTTNKDTYELINLLDSQGLVYDTIQEYFNENQKVLSVKEASDLVESYLEQQIDKAAATKKFRNKFAKPTASETKSQPAQQRTQTQPRTLSNEMTSTAPSFLPAKTENERIQRAMAALDK